MVAKTLFNAFLCIFIALLPISIYAKTDSYCEVLIPTHLEKVPRFPLFILRGCKVNGSLINIGPYLVGHFIVDLRSVTSGMKKFDYYLKKKYLDLKNNRYAVLSLHPIEIGDRRFTALLKLNGRSENVSGEVISSSTDHLDAYLTIDLDDYNFVPDYGWKFIQKKIDIHARIFTNDFKKPSKDLPK